jgi:tRNA (guanosine-2'-O-)-methyltransferase
MGGGGAKYEDVEDVPSPEEFLLEERLERIDDVLSRRTRTLTVVLDQLEDTFNMAAVLRTCEGMGLQEVHVIQNSKVPFKPNRKVTQGCHKWLDVHSHENFAACQKVLKERGFQIWVSDLGQKAESLFDMKFEGKMALVFGNERYGVTQEVLDGAEGIFWIPMRGFTQSFNISAAVSASVTQAIAWRIRHQGEQGDLTTEEMSELSQKFRFLSVKQRKRIYGE